MEEETSLVEETLAEAMESMESFTPSPYRTPVHEPVTKATWDTPLFGAPKPRYEQPPRFFGEKVLRTLKADYYEVVDNPKRLPGFLHAVVSREREMSFKGDRKYFSPAIYLQDHVGVRRQIYFNFELENLVVGTIGGLLTGLATKEYFSAYGRFAQMTSQHWLRAIEMGTANPVQKLFFGGIVASRVMRRAVMGGVVFDLLKRNMEKTRGKNDWLNATFAGALSGAGFGLRGGFHTAILGAFGFSLGSTLFHLAK